MVWVDSIFVNPLSRCSKQTDINIHITILYTYRYMYTNSVEIPVGQRFLECKEIFVWAFLVVTNRLEEYLSKASEAAKARWERVISSYKKSFPEGYSWRTPRGSLERRLKTERYTWGERPWAKLLKEIFREVIYFEIFSKQCCKNKAKRFRLIKEDETVT